MDLLVFRLAWPGPTPAELPRIATADQYSAASMTKRPAERSVLLADSGGPGRSQLRRRRHFPTALGNGALDRPSGHPTEFGCDSDA